MSRRTRIAGLAALVAVAACGGRSSSSLAWQIEFASPGVASRAVAVEAEIVQGSCESAGGSRIYATTIRRMDRAMTVAPADLAPGEYAFRARATDERCQYFATGCTSLTVPSGRRRVVTVLDLAAEPTPACDVDRCRGGVCEVDAGPPVPPDAGPTPRDTGPLPVPDAGPTRCGPECALGCSSAEPLRCAALIPLNFPSERVAAGADVDVSSMTLVDTTACTGLAGAGVILTTGTGEATCVFRVGNLHVRATGAVVASGSRPLAIFASGDVLVEGVVDVSATGDDPGAGGGAPGQDTRTATGPSAGENGSIASAAEDWQNGGGGGGGLCGAGGAGGDGREGEGGAGGGRHDTPGLYGGSGGGKGAAQSEMGAAGGAGGGALQISCANAITIAGAILAGGGGGHGALAGQGAGGGGGSGGMIVLEAPVLTIAESARVHAIGGGGGGSRGTTAPGQTGQDGAMAVLRASGGAGGEPGNSWPGGDSGGGRTAAELDGIDGGGSWISTAPPRGGGGGGGAGCIRLGTLDGSPPAGGSVVPGSFATHRVSWD